jgi:hypothetical protein
MENRMACNSDDLRPTPQQRKLQHAAQLLAYVQEQTVGKVEKWVKKIAEDHYANSSKAFTALCDLLTAMKPEELEMIVYNAHSRMSRRLADWWEDHQAADNERKRREAASRRKKALRKQALSKLSPEEREALLKK